jgi:hypothetical protein
MAAAGVARPTDPIFYAAIWFQAMLILGVGVAWLQSTLPVPMRRSAW